MRKPEQIPKLGAFGSVVQATKAGNFRCDRGFRDTPSRGGSEMLDPNIR